MNRITALIVTYNSADHIAACVNAALTYCAEVLVVDNASTDATLATIPKGARVIVNPRNQGFAGGVNVGMNEAGFDTVLLLNPDAGPFVRCCGPRANWLQCAAISHPSGTRF
jgi:GT2 family glycosyltransferase